MDENMKMIIGCGAVLGVGQYLEAPWLISCGDLAKTINIVIFVAALLVTAEKMRHDLKQASSNVKISFRLSRANVHCRTALSSILELG